LLFTFSPIAQPLGKLYGLRDVIIERHCIVAAPLNKRGKGTLYTTSDY